jgi:uncharacterized phage protein (TIGR01671 family)
MREIKFRAWDKVGKTMIPFDEPRRCIEYGLIAWASSKHMGIGALPGSYVYLMDETEEGEEDPYVLMQFTGLLDKNGKEIYEGDVVKRIIDTSYDTGTYPPMVIEKRVFIETVYWIDETAGFSPFHENFGEEIEVIGNIYANPELVKR